MLYLPYSQINLVSIKTNNEIYIIEKNRIENIIKYHNRLIITLVYQYSSIRVFLTSLLTPCHYHTSFSFYPLKNNAMYHPHFFIFILSMYHSFYLLFRVGWHHLFLTLMHDFIIYLNLIWYNFLSYSSSASSFFPGKLYDVKLTLMKSHSLKSSHCQDVTFNIIKSQSLLRSQTQLSRHIHYHETVTRVVTVTLMVTITLMRSHSLEIALALVYTPSHEIKLTRVVTLTLMRSHSHEATLK